MRSGKLATRPTALLAILLLVGSCASGGDGSDQADPGADVVQVWFSTFEGEFAAIGLPSGCEVSTVAQVESGGELLDVAAGDGLVWVADPGGSLTAIDPTSGAVTDTFSFDPNADAALQPLAETPTGVALLVDGGIQHYDRGGPNGPVVALPEGVTTGISSVDGRLYAQSDSTLMMLDPATLEVTDALPAGGRLDQWVSAGDDVVMLSGDQLSVATDGTVRSDVTLTETVYVLAVSGGRVVLSGPSGLTSHDLDDLTNFTTLQEAGGSRPKITYSVGEELWVVDEDGPSLSEVDPVTGAELRSIDLPGRSDDPQLNLIELADDLALLTDAETGDMYALDTDAGEVDRVGTSSLFGPIAVVPATAPCEHD